MILIVRKVLNEKKADLINKIKRRKRKLLGKEPINPEENGLRRRVRNLNFYEQASFRLSPDENKLDFSWDTDLCERFLSIRPTIAQLLTVLGLRELIIDSKKKHRNIGYVPALIHIPDKPGWVRLRIMKRRI